MEKTRKVYVTHTRTRNKWQVSRGVGFLQVSVLEQTGSAEPDATDGERDVDADEFGLAWLARLP